METSINLPQIPHKVQESFKKNHFEQETWALNGYIIGIDEVGRGCSAGPVVAAAVMLHPHAKHPLLKDSKLLTHAELEKAAEWIKKHAWWGIGIASNHTIDTVNIYKATQEAMCRALAQLQSITPQKPSKILVDAMPLTQQTFQAETLYFIKGERKSTSIAAASIIAKVYRDQLMEKLSFSFPGYQLAKHKGYCTPCHQLATATYGMSIIHRSKWFEDKQPKEENGQQNLFC